MHNPRKATDGDPGRTTGKPVYIRSQLEKTFLPVGQMLQIDRVLEINGANMTCELDTFDHWVFPMHFPTDPIFPGSLLIEAAGQTVALWAWHTGLRGNPRMVKVDAKFEIPVRPADQTVVLKTRVRLKRNVCLGQVELFVMERNELFMTERKIAEINPMIIVAAA
jgi:3-hydroxymyristoyl/3-hydroxydecanoyl-(acyl carrier protein) dehydratase